MSNAATYSVSTTGHLVDGFDSDKVTAEFSSLFRIAPEKAALYTSRVKVIKKNLSLDDAERYRDTLIKIGLGVEVLDADGKPFAEKSDPLEIVPMDDAVAEQSGPSGVLSAIELVELANTDDNGFRCPKCEMVQEPGEQCVSCGVYVEKFKAAQSAYGMAGSTTPASGRPGGKAVKRRAKPATVEVDDDSLSVKGLALAVVAAVAGAFVWYLIATTFDRELGFVAWGVGGAIGLAAAFGGSRSDMAGIACGILVVLAIFGGKYMAMSSFASNYQAAMAEDFSDDDFLAMYKEFLFDANAFGEIDSSKDDEVRSYMVDHRFIDVESAKSVSDEDLDYFRAEYQPGLEQQLVSPANFDQWQADVFGDVAAVFQQISPLTMVMDNLGLLDIVFLLLGVSTAFQLARQGSSRGPA